MASSHNVIAKLIKDSIAVKQELLDDSAQLLLIDRIATDIVAALQRGNKVIFCGNGGSFADSIHLTAELVSRFQNGKRKPFAGIALGTNSSTLTAISNDYEYEETFAREIMAIGQAGDILIALSTSGSSENVLRAVNAALGMNIQVFGMTGKSGGKLANTAAIAGCLKVPSDVTARIQESHILVGHIICELVENALSKSDG
ncbi:Phosphoheptose isomerase [Gammaproteobacteria bacterium]